MKTLIIAVGLLGSFSAFADPQPNCSIRTVYCGAPDDVTVSKKETVDCLKEAQESAIKTGLPTEMNATYTDASSGMEVVITATLNVKATN